MKQHECTAFPSHASLIAASLSAALFSCLAAPSALAFTYYWDNDGAADGFGIAAGAWAAPTTGDATQGWSQDGTGATEPVGLTTTTDDSINFGNGATGLAAGTITVGTVDSGDMTFASGSGAIVLSGGDITLAAASTITANNASNTINSNLAGAATSLTIIGANTGLVLGGTNTFGPLTIGSGTSATGSTKVSFSSFGNLGSGDITLGNATGNGGILEFTGAGAAASYGTSMKIGASGTGTSGGTIQNNNADQSHTLTFSNTAFNTENGTGARMLTLGGTHTGDNTISGAIINNGTGALSLTKADAGKWILTGANTRTGTTAINAGTLQVDTGGTLGAITAPLTMGTGSDGVAGTVGNLTLNTNAQVAGMTVKSNSASTNLLSIAAGSTLTASGFTAGIATTTNNVTTNLGTGAAGTGGTLTVNGNFTMSPSAGNTSVKSTTVVNLSGLDTFNLTGTNLTVGSAPNSAATLTLANNANNITITTLTMGDGGNYNIADNSYLKLGSGTNTLKADTIQLGGTKGAGQVAFSGANGSINITNKAGTGSASITIGLHESGSYSGGGASTLSLAGHNATVSGGTVIIARKTGAALSGSYNGALTFDTGTFNASTIQMSVASAGSSNLNSTFTVGGATANSAATGVVTIGGNLLLGAPTGGAASPVATLTINGGTVKVNNTTPTSGEGIFDTSTVGTSTTTLTLAGGTLNLNGGTIGGTTGTGKRNITNLNFRSGTLQNVFQINDGAGLTKTTAGTLTLSGTNSFTGGVTINAGTLALGVDNALPDSNNVVIGAATFDAVTFDDTVETLDVTGAAIINLGAGANLAFADSSGIGGGVWAGTLNITGALEATSLRFGTTSGGLTPAQLASISVNGSGAGTYTLDSGGYLVGGGASGYSAWASLNTAGPNLNDNHDNDGVDNGVEYFIGGPTGNTTGFTPLPGVVDTDGTLSVTWTKAAGYTGTYGTDYVVETSSTLSGVWTPQDADPTPGFTVTFPSATEVKFTFPSGPVNFARLRVTGP